MYFLCIRVNLKSGLLCVACDIPAVRRVCGFLGHMAKLGCSKCTKEFHINLETGHLVLVVSMMAKMNHPYEMNLTTVNKQIWPPCKQLKLQKIV